MLRARWTTRPVFLRIIPPKHTYPSLQLHNRTYSSSTPPSTAPRKPKRADKFNYNTRPENADAASEHVNYRIVTANDLESYVEPPRRVKMLVRDYIEDALYNPNYGYFPKQVTIFNGLGEEIDFNSIRNGNEFQDVVARRYEGYGKDGEGPGRQIFHTPTELFRVCCRSLLVIIRH